MLREKRWPKRPVPLTPEEQAIADDWMRYWLNQLPQHYGFIDNWNHTYPVKHCPTSFTRTLEIGAGRGEHLLYERLTPEQEANYVIVDKRRIVAPEILQKYPAVQVTIADCQEKLPYQDDYFDRCLALHVLEHLPDLPATIRELHRVCHKKHGQLAIVIPCEGSIFYEFCRTISTRRIFEKRYNISYKTIMSREHLNTPAEILEELRPYFYIDHEAFFPFKIPLIAINLIIGAILRPK